MKLNKTNAMRILDKYKIDYETYIYDRDLLTDAQSLANQIGQDVERIYKTIVLENGQNHYVAVIPLTAHLDMKKVAKAFGIKKIALLHPQRLFETTGYIRGGCSPIGMKKLFPTMIDESALNFDSIIVSAGKVGQQMSVKASDILKLTNGRATSLQDSTVNQ